MIRQDVNSPDAPLPKGGYSQAVSIKDFERLVFVSGQIPVGSDERLPETFLDQASLAWSNVDAQLHAAGMSRDDIVKVTVFCRIEPLRRRTVRRAKII